MARLRSPARPEDVPDLADHLQHAFRSLSHALPSLTCCIDCTPPHEREPHSFEVSQHVYRASMVTGNAGAGLLRDQPLRGTARTGSAAAETGYELARRTSAAYLSMGPPSSATLAARTAAIEAFLHATVNPSVAVATLAAQLPARWQRSCRTPAHAGSPRRKPASPKLMSIWPARWNAPVSARGSQAGAPSHSERATAIGAEPPSSSPGPPAITPAPALAVSSFPASPAGEPTEDSAASPAPLPRLPQRLTAVAHRGATAMTGSASGRLPGAMPAAATAEQFTTAHAPPIPRAAIPGRESSPGFPGKAGSYGRSRRP